MPYRPLLRRALLVTALAAICLPALAHPQPRPIAPDEAGRRLYIVQLAEPPLAAGSGPMAPTLVERSQEAALDTITGALGKPTRPDFTYQHAFNGFALRLTPDEAARVASLPGVEDVGPDYEQELHTDTGPAFIGAAQADQRPAIFRAALDGAQAGAPASAGGSATFVYDAATRTLTVQLFYQGLSATPAGASLHIGAPGQSGPAALSLDPLSRPGANAYVGALSLDGAPELGQSPGQVEQALFAGNLYVNIETTAYPGGELRGQITAVRGEGVLVGVIDSGIDFTSPSFADPAADGFDATNPRGAGAYLGVCSASDGDGRYDSAFGCNDKLIGAYTFAGTDESPDRQGGPSPRDNHGHGTHTASTAIGGLVPEATLGAATIGPIAGVAPHATLIAYDVCGIEPASDPQNSLRCSAAAILAAIDQAVADGVDVINYSIGGGSRNPWTSDDSESFLVAAMNGAFVATSAGNTGPGAGSLGAPSNAPWVTSVAATTHSRRFVNGLSAFAGGDLATRPGSPLEGRGYSAGLAAARVEDAAASDDTGGQPNRRCDAFAPGTNFQGAIVICQLGGLPRLAMVANVAAANGGGVVLVNDAATGERLVDEPYPLPTVYLGYSDGQTLLAWAQGCGACTARIDGTSRSLDAARGDVLAAFSARGPDSSNPDVLKPDLAAPGVDILASGLNVNPSAPDFQLISGTSMASPHVAGVAALLRQLHPDWSVAEVKSAMMLTAAARVRDEAGAAADPFSRGAGRVQAGLAALAGLVLDESYEAFLAADPAQGGDPTALNLASIAERECAVSCAFSRTLRSTLGITATWNVSTNAAPQLALTVAPASFTLAPGAEQTITVTTTPSGMPGGDYLFGAVTLSEQSGLAPASTMPVAIRPAVSTLPRSLEIVTNARSGGTTLDVRAQAINGLNLSSYGLAQLSRVEATLPQDSTTGDLNDGAGGGLLVRSLTLPAGTTRFRAELGPTSAPDLDLYVFSDSDGDKLLDLNELLCTSTADNSAEVCDLIADDPINGYADPLPITILVQNFRGSQPGNPRFADALSLLFGAVGRSASGNLTVSGPTNVPAGESFGLDLAWQLPDARDGDIYIGMLSLGSAPSQPGNLGSLALTVRYEAQRLYLPLMRR
jgi:subtilisin family serine protease